MGADTDKLFEMLYSKKKILNELRDTDEIKRSEIRASRINTLMDIRIFDEHFIEKLSSSTPYSEIEACYQYILQTIFVRVPLFAELRNRNYHVIVTGGIEFREESIGNEIAIILEWPLIKFLDLLNSNIIKSESFNHFRESCILVMSYYRRRYIQGESINLFSSIFDISSFTSVQYRINMLLQQIQTIFILSHELGHLLCAKLSGLTAEIAADKAALESVIMYCRDEQRIRPFIIIGVMLLFSYLTLLDVSMKNGKQKKISTREAWLARYDAIMDRADEIELSEQDMTMISGYDEICKIIDEICIDDIDSSDS